MIQRQHSNQRMSQLVSFANLVWSAGQVAKDPSEDMAGQTRQVLAQIVFEGETADGLFDEGLLRRLIELRRHPERGVLSRHIAGALESFPDTPARTAPPGGGHRNDARARIDALQTRIERLINEVDRGRR